MPTLPIMTNTYWLTLALIVITAFYAWATLKILRANEAMVSTMRDQQNAAMRRYILVSTSVRTGTQLPQKWYDRDWVDQSQKIWNVLLSNQRLLRQVLPERPQHSRSPIGIAPF